MTHGAGVAAQGSAPPAATPGRALASPISSQENRRTPSVTSTTQNPEITAGKTISLIPRVELFGNPEQTRPTISPDGQWLAWVAPYEGVLNLWVRHLADGGDARPVTADHDRGIHEYAWAPDSLRLLYLRDQDGDENKHLYDVTLRTGDVRDLTQFVGVKAELVAQDLHITDRVLIGLNKNNPQLHDVYALDLITGELTMVLENPGMFGFVADSQLRIRAGVSPTPDGGSVILVRDVESDWRLLLTVDATDAQSTMPLGFDQDGNRLLVLTPTDANATRLVWINVHTGEHDVVAGDPTYDVSSVKVDASTREPVMVSFQRERLHPQALTPDIRRDLDILAAVNDGDIQVVSADRANTRWIVSYVHADGPTASHLYDRATGEATFLFHDRPRLAGRLHRVEPFSVTARDGLELHGYLTIPAGNTEKLPTVLLVHGGPRARDTWELTPLAQWLANRGYLCLQVDYRGSTGYGKSFTAAGNREWGAKMQDDLLDALVWAVEAGYADPDRVGIFGGSYGGYAALAGAAFTPEVFRCAISLCGPSNLETLLRSIPDHLALVRAQMYIAVGNPDTDAEFLWSRSPLSRVATMKTPLLIGQGANDTRVPQAESDQIVDALRANGVPPEYALYDDEGHGLEKPENRFEFYTRAERFLAKHLGGRFEPEPA
ncbi:S9 family peptidase [Amycolatopsis sp. NPDC051758]|uniref:S9 family peptidase n=1 Tax=Amycolatopsis sp. NPDC051758 TaxID=3363935 RepID=UPI00379F8A57